MNAKTLITSYQRYRRIKKTATEVIDLLTMAAEATDPASRAELLDLAAVAEGELHTLAVQMYAPQPAPDFASTSRLLRYAALAERALGKAEWTRAGDLSEGDLIWRLGDQRVITAMERPQGDPLAVCIKWDGPLGVEGEAFEIDELVPTGQMGSDPAILAEREGAGPAEVVLWEALTCLPNRTGRAVLYRELAALPRYAQRDETRHLLEALALQEHHLSPDTPRHPDLVAAEIEDRRVRLSERAVLATVIATVAVYAFHGDGPRWWLVALVGMALAAALRFGAHERLGR
ncbi:hypothetical protein [Actinocorallia populi]|uniref:hypothetical protein n=1 Tax=Actinocorallia populi TaxID=2079200 RepID=UPI000D095223|nr:hypothetical protein [Actinocorallia populi]